MNTPKSLELARRTCGTRSQPRSTSQIHPNVEPKGGGWTDNDEIQERGKRQTHPHHEEDGVRVPSGNGVCKGCLMIRQPNTTVCRARIATRMENDPAHAKRLEEKPTKRVEFANPELEVPPPSESRTDKGGSERVEVRSRLIARDIKQKGTDSHFAGTPPLALARHVISRPVTKLKTGRRRQLMVYDAKRAFLHVDAVTGTYVKPPQQRDTERCWQLKKCMYGTVPAAAGWQHFGQKVGALSSSSCPCAFGQAT